jgi:hypothetical protein
MTITADLFEAYLKCPMKCWLRAKQTCEAATGNAYSEWVERQVAAHRSKGIESLFATISETECAISVQKAALKTAKWWLAANVSVNAGKAESCLHALERIPSEGRGKSVQFVPIRFIPTDKVTRDDKLLLGFDALVFSDSLAENHLQQAHPRKRFCRIAGEDAGLVSIGSAKDAKDCRIAGYRGAAGSGAEPALPGMSVSKPLPRKGH